MARGRKVREVTKVIVWGRAAGRCQFRNCPERLDRDLVAGRAAKNNAYLAHIIAADPDGPRGDAELSHQLADDFENLMLMCDPHHREIDDPATWRDYPPELLREMKRDHERWVDYALSAGYESASHILQVSAPIGPNETAVRFDDCVAAIMPEHTPASNHPLEIKIRGMRHVETDPHYYETELRNLRVGHADMIKRRFEGGNIKHLSIFALAPIPLLVELGRLIPDLLSVTVYQPHREPRQQWKWATDSPPIEFRERRGARGPKRVALKLSISAAITDDRVVSVLGEEISIWELTCAAPHNDIMRRRDDLSDYRSRIRRMLDEIKEQHGLHAELSVFPAIPASCAVELGRVWQPKAHLPMEIYDQSSAQRGFVRRLRIATD